MFKLISRTTCCTKKTGAYREAKMSCEVGYSPPSSSQLLLVFQWCNSFPADTASPLTTVIALGYLSNTIYACTGWCQCTCMYSPYICMIHSPLAHICIIHVLMQFLHLYTCMHVYATLHIVHNDYLSLDLVLCNVFQLCSCLTMAISECICIYICICIYVYMHIYMHWSIYITYM
jgi:hypothetical protein